MRIVLLVFLLLLLSLGCFVSCNKWTDPKPVTDPRLTNSYCNDPRAVNYNWGFPGKPDNTVCYYPADLFRGNYIFTDTVYSQSGSTAGLFILAKTDTLNIYSLSITKLAVIGFCGHTDSLKITAASLTFAATIDTLVGDSLTNAHGQMLCRTVDTISGTIVYSRLDSLLHVSFLVVSDSGITTHTGIARKK